MGSCALLYMYCCRAQDQRFFFLLYFVFLFYCFLRRSRRFSHFSVLPYHWIQWVFDFRRCKLVSFVLCAARSRSHSSLIISTYIAIFQLLSCLLQFFCVVSCCCVFRQNYCFHTKKKKKKNYRRVSHAVLFYSLREFALAFERCVDQLSVDLFFFFCLLQNFSIILFAILQRSSIKSFLECFEGLDGQEWETTIMSLEWCNLFRKIKIRPRPKKKKINKLGKSVTIGSDYGFYQWINNNFLKFMLCNCCDAMDEKKK